MSPLKLIGLVWLAALLLVGLGSAGAESGRVRGLQCRVHRGGSPNCQECCAKYNLVGTTCKLFRNCHCSKSKRKQLEKNLPAATD